MTAEPAPGYVGPLADEMRAEHFREMAAREALTQPEPVESEPEEPDTETSSPDIGTFDAEAYARGHWRAPRNTVGPRLIPKDDPLFGVLSGGTLETLALDTLRMKYRRNGVRYSINSHTGVWTPQ